MEMRSSYLDYAMSVIVSRALPDVRDGLKPVQRRILYAMLREGLRHDHRYSKCAGIVGEVLKKYHPHGDMAVYDALVRLAQPWNMRYPLIDGQGNFGCFTGDTKIKLLDGTERTFEELARWGPDEVFYVYSVDACGRIVVGEGRHSRITRRNAQVIELTLDDGSTIRCTPDHRFMLRDGTWKQAQNLTIDDSLMAGYFDTAPINRSTNDYLRVLQPTTGEYEFVHRLADEYNEKHGLTDEVEPPFVRHHKNFNRFDNNPENIERMNWLEHLHLHAEQVHALWQDDDFRAAQRAGIQHYYATHPEVVEERRQRMVAQNQSEAFRSENGDRVSQSLREWHKNNPDVARQRGEYLRQLWQDPEYRTKMSKILHGIKKRPLTPEQKQQVSQIIAEKSRAMWADTAMREKITRAIIRAMENPELRAQLSARAQELWQDPEYRAKYPPDHHQRMAQVLWEDPAVREQHRTKMIRQWEDPAFRASHLEGRKREYAARIAQNPDCMKELSVQSALALHQKWGDAEHKQRVMRTKIAGFVSRLIAEYGYEQVTPEHYEARRNANWIPSFQKALTYFESFEELLDTAARHNHRVVHIRWLDECFEVYDITVDEHHNFMLENGCVVHNSIDSDPPAAYRYTEARLTEIAEELLVDIDKNTVDFRPNFDGEHEEPKVLPALLPNLLLNGASGIAVGMATNIPPHNLNELCDTIIHLVDDPDTSVDDLIHLLPGPDFPTGATILGTDGIINAYTTGKGRIIMRARAHVEEGARGSFHIVVTELPYQVNKARLHERIAEMVKDRKIEGIRDIQDQSDRTGMRLVIMLKQDAQPRKVLNALYRHSQMQATFGVNMLALTDEGTQPRVLNLKRTLRSYIEHRQEVIRRRTEFELEKARARAHILEGLKIALDNLDEVIRTIRESRTVEVARTNLMERFQLSEIQSQAILDMQLRRLAALERQKIEEEYQAVLKLITELEAILADPQKILDLIKADLRMLKEKYGDERRTRIIPNVDGEVSDEDLIPDVRVLVTLTNRGYTKRLPVDTYRTQRRGGRGVLGMQTREQDVVRHIVVCSTMDSLLFFTDRGKVYHLKAHEIPDASRTAKGLPLVNLVSLEPGEQVTSVLHVPDFDDGEYLVMATVRGKVKRTLLKEYSQVRSNGLIAIGLEEGDELGWVMMSQGHEDILLTTAFGQTIRFRQDQVRPVGRPAIGVNGINLNKEGDRVVGMSLAHDDADLLIMTTRGFGKRTSVSEYPVKGRATSGVITVRLRQDDQVAAAHVIKNTSLITIITTSGIVNRQRAGGISRLGRATQGVTIINLSKGDRVAALSFEEPPGEEGIADGSDLSEDGMSTSIEGEEMSVVIAPLEGDEQE